METFSALLAICGGNSPVPGEFPTQRPVMFSLICVRITGRVNNHEAGDLRRYHALYDDIVMQQTKTWTNDDQDPRCPVDALVQDGSISSALTMEILQSCTTPVDMVSLGYDDGWINQLHEQWPFDKSCLKRKQI